MARKQRVVIDEAMRQQQHLRDMVTLNADMFGKQWATETYGQAFQQAADTFFHDPTDHNLMLLNERILQYRHARWLWEQPSQQPS